MFRPLVFTVALALFAYPAQAAGPLVLIAKQLVQQIIVDFIEARIADTIRASFGPCKADLAEDAIQGSRAIAGMLRGGGGGRFASLGSIGNVGHVGNLAALGSAGSAASLLSGAPNVAAGVNAARAAGTAVDGVAALGAASGGATQALGAMGIAVPGMGGVGVAELSQLASRGMPSMPAGTLVQMAGMQQMMAATPLGAAELDDLAHVGAVWKSGGRHRARHRLQRRGLQATVHAHEHHERRPSPRRHDGVDDRRNVAHDVHELQADGTVTAEAEQTFAR